MSETEYADCIKTNFLAEWMDVYKFRKPLIAAVNGYAVIHILLLFC